MTSHLLIHVACKYLSKQCIIQYPVQCQSHLLSTGGYILVTSMTLKIKAFIFVVERLLKWPQPNLKLAWSLNDELILGLQRYVLQNIWIVCYANTQYPWSDPQPIFIFLLTKVIKGYAFSFWGFSDQCYPADLYIG